MSSEALDIIFSVIAGLGGGGVIGAILSVWAARKKVPAEVDSIIVNSAETTTQAALAVAAAESGRADREAARADRAEERVDLLLAQLDQAQQLIDAIRTELYELKTNNA